MGFLQLFFFLFVSVSLNAEGPFFYVTFQGEDAPAVSNVLKYSLDGKFLGPVLLNYNGICRSENALEFDGHYEDNIPPIKNPKGEEEVSKSSGRLCYLRGISLTEFGTLIVANSRSSHHQTRLLEYGRCIDGDGYLNDNDYDINENDINDNDNNDNNDVKNKKNDLNFNNNNNGKRLFLRNITVSSKRENPYLDHSYGVLYWDGNYLGKKEKEEAVFTSVQNTDSVLRYSYHQSQFMGGYQYEPSPTFYRVNSLERTMRGISSDSSSGLLFVSIEDANTVAILDLLSGSLYKNLSVAFPIHPLFYRDGESGKSFLFVSCNDPSDYRVEVFEWKGGIVFERMEPFREKKMEHPTGMVVFQNMLYVLSQKNRKLLGFDLKKKTSKVKTIAHFDDKPEQLILSPC